MKPLDRTDLEHLKALLEGRQETAILDFKGNFDPSSQKDKVELAKDLGAMLSTFGGHIILGVDDEHGSFTGHLDEVKPSKFDPSNLGRQFQKWLPGPIDIRSAVHTIDEHKVVVIYIAPHRDGFAPFTSDGQYEDERGRPKTVFREGEVFCRHGPTSERWNQLDFQAYRERIRTQEREKAADEYTARLLEFQAEAQRASTLTAGPASAYSWRLESRAFTDAATEYLRAGDRIPITLMLRETRSDVTRMTRQLGEDPADLDLLFDRVTDLAALALVLRDRDLFRSSVEALTWAYNSVIVDQWGSPDPQLNVSAPRYWMSIIARVIALGGVAVREQAWWAVRLLSECRPRNDYYDSWLRHGLTMAARANLLIQQHGRKQSLITFAAEAAQRMPTVVGDLATAEDNLDSLCQFDFLACVIAERHGWGWYPNFSSFESRRTAPAAELLITDRSLRDNADLVSDDLLARALRAVAHTAEREAVKFGAWDGYDSEAVREFLEAHPSPAQDN